MTAPAIETSPALRTGQTVDNPPAFPAMTTSSFMEGGIAHFGHPSYSPGMTLGDFFAAHALTGLCARMSEKDFNDISSGSRVGGLEAAVALTLADAMLKGRDAK